MIILSEYLPNTVVYTTSKERGKCIYLHSVCITIPSIVRMFNLDDVIVTSSVYKVNDLSNLKFTFTSDLNINTLYCWNDDQIEQSFYFNRIYDTINLHIKWELKEQ